MTTETLPRNLWTSAVLGCHSLPLTSELDREEADWIVRAQAGEEAAYRWLLERYRPRVVRLAAHVLRRDSEAEDVAQEAFLRAFRSLPGYSRQGRFSAWLFQIVARLCLDRQRRPSWRSEVAEHSEPIPKASPHDADMQILVAALLDQLTPPMRAALILREMEGLEYEEISSALGIPVGTVRSRLHTARAQFRKLWEAAMEETDHV